jgi:predicted nucleotidyltransferase
MTVVEAQHEAFVAEVVEVVEAFGVPVLGAYVLGSALLGGFDPRTSDLDLVFVVARRLDTFERAAVVRALDELRVPARKLELVVYAVGAKPPAYELNYPDGDGEPPHWFVLDAAIAQERAQPFAGRPWGELLELVSDDEVRLAAQASLDWSLQQPADDEFARRNAVRTRHYLEHGEWITKKEASE